MCKQADGIVKMGNSPMNPWLREVRKVDLAWGSERVIRRSESEIEPIEEEPRADCQSHSQV